MTQDTALYPFLRYKDAPAAIEFLCEAFGFAQLMNVPGEGGSVAHAELHLGPVIIMVGTGPDSASSQPPDDPRSVSQGLYLAISNVDEHCERVRAAGARIVRESEDTEYGSREYAAVDPGGYYWSFGTYRPAVE